LVPFDTSEAIFANEVVPPGAQGLQLLAEGPRTAMPQPREGDDLARWLELKVGAPGQGSPTFREIELPSGPAVVLERLDRPLAPTAWRIFAAAIRTPLGVAFLLVDGPPASWAGREEDAAVILWLLEFGPGRRP